MCEHPNDVNKENQPGILNCFKIRGYFPNIAYENPCMLSSHIRAKALEKVTVDIFIRALKKVVALIKDFH